MLAAFVSLCGKQDANHERSVRGSTAKSPLPSIHQNIDARAVQVCVTGLLGLAVRKPCDAGTPGCCFAS